MPWEFFCGSEKSICLANGLFAGSSCQYSAQCATGWCNDGSCRGRDAVSESYVNGCSGSNECEIGQRCSKWNVANSISPQCHDLSSGFCYDDNDCWSYYYTNELSQQCRSGASSGSNYVGKCTPLAQLGDACNTLSTTSTCAYFDDTLADGTKYRNSYTCNHSMNPARCVKPAAPVGQGSPCDVSSSSTAPPCDTLTYCQLTSTQPRNTSNATNPGTCQTRYNIPLNSNCSDLNYACAAPNYCKPLNGTPPYICTAPVNSLGKVCNHTSPELDSSQCPNSTGTLYCACNDTCSLPVTTTSFSCSPVHRIASLYSFPYPPTPAIAHYSGSQPEVADYYCCNYCGSSTNGLAISTGVIVDCGTLKIRTVDFCDNTFNITTRWLQNCPVYVPNTGVVASWSFFTVTILSIVVILSF